MNWLGSLGPALILELLALGITAGFLAGLLGIGGGMLMVPFLTFIVSARGVEPALAVKMAVATSMATILFTSYGNIMIDSVTEAQHKLSPVAAVGPMTVVMLVRPDLPYKTIEELVAYARANPQKISFASVGIGSSYHLLIEQMNTLGKLDMVHIPYKGGAASMADFLGGRVDVMLATWLFAKPYVNDNRARAVALTNAERSPTLPNLPTVNERAVPGVKLIDGLGVFAPKGLPEALVARLNKEINQIIPERAMKTWLTNEAIPPTPMTTAAFEKMLVDEAKPLEKLIRENKIGMK